MPRQTDSRARMVETAAELFRQQGYHATAFSEVVAVSGAPRGSIYFHFPGGKEELAVAAAARAVDEAAGIVEAAASKARDAAGFARAFADLVCERLESSEFRKGCAIATMVLELAPQVEAVRAEFDRGFTVGRQALADQFRRYGYEPARADALAVLFLSAIEGALILARAARSVEPLQAASGAFITLLEPPPAAARSKRRPTAGR